MIDQNRQAKQDIAKTLGLGDPNAPHALGKKHRLWIAAMLAVAAVIALFILQSRPKPVSYTTEQVRRGDLIVTVSATGTLAPVKEVEVGIEVSGTIKHVEADYNDRVTVGQVLARLDTTRLEAQALQSKASLEAARAKVLQIQAGLQEARVKMARLDKALALSGGKVPSQYELDTAKATLARAIADEVSAKASVAQAQAALDVNRTDLAKAVVHSPINGVVLERSVEPGQTVASQFQAPVLFTLAEDLTQMELQVDVDEADVGLVREGQDAQFSVDAYPDRMFPARITQVRFGAQTVEGVVTYKTVLKVDNSTLSLRPGMTATAVITVNKKTNALLVPNTVLRFTPPASEVDDESKSGGLVSVLLPRMPSQKPKTAAAAASASKEQQVWTVRNGELAAMTISKGVTDGIVTEIVGGPVTEGMALVTDSSVSGR